MDTLTESITRYLLGRIRRRDILDVYRKAADAGLLDERHIAGDERQATVWSLTAEAAQVLTGVVDRDHKLLARRLRTSSSSRGDAHIELFDIETDRDAVLDVPEPRETERKIRAPAENPQVKQCIGPASSDDAADPTSYVLSLLRQQMPRPSAGEVAVALLLARAVGRSLPDRTELATLLRQPHPCLLVKVPVPRFERRFTRMLEGGLVLPRQVKIADVYHGASLREDYGAERRSKPRVLVKLLSGAGARRFDHATLSRYIGDALLKRAAPVVIVDETALPSSPTLSMTADVVCACAGLDHALLAELLHTVLGIAPKRSFPKMAEMALDLEGLSIDDLTLAIRSGRDLDATLASLAALAEQARAGGESEEGKEDAAAGGKDGSGQSKTSKSGKGSSAAKTRPTGDAVDIIQPAKPPSATLADRMVAEAGSLEPVKSMGHSYLSIETLSGYGEARQWALDLKVDIDVWRHAELSWSDMSTKLLLSGPPGTGKTTYARALSNTLQVPLLVTSVAAWLEPGYLGDVLKRMSHAFETARQQAPAILFIDEIDNIGSRGGSRRDYDDYWRSLINRLLELLDGASKTEGVIVVAATNLPETIDPALLRSGRLEKHVAIPLPDIGALGGILAHHLGADLATVLSTAPIPPISRRLRPRQARDHDPQQLRKSAARRKAREIKGAPQ